jgi:hypothetical protein
MFTLSLCSIIFFNSITDLSIIYSNDNDDNFMDAFWCLFFIIYAGLIGLFVLILFLLQLIMIARGLTTLELLRNYWKGMINPYNRGCFKNCFECLTHDRTSRNLSLSQIVMLSTQDFEMSGNSSLNISINNTSLTSSFV